MRDQPENQPAAGNDQDILVAALLDSVAAPLIVLDPQGRILHWNQAGQTAAGRPLNQAPHPSFWEVFPLPAPVEAGGLPAAFETDSLTSSGDRQRLAWSQRVVADPAGTVKYLICQAQDLAKPQPVSEALWNSQQMLQLVLNHIPQRVFWKARDFTYQGCNQLFARDAGLDSPAAVCGKNDFELAWQASAALYRADDRQVMETDTAKVSFEEPQLQPDGRQLWLRTSKIPLHDQAGGVIGLLGTYEDITERKQAENALRQNGATLRALLNAISDSAFLMEPDGRVVEANETVAGRMQVSVEQLIGRNMYDFVAPEVAALRRKYVDQVIQTGQAARFEDLRGGRYIDNSINPVFDASGRVTRLAVFGSDNTDRKQAEAALDYERRLLRTVIDTVPDQIFARDTACRFTLNNRADALAMGVADPELLRGKSDIDFYPPDLAARYQADDRRVIETGQPLVNREEPGLAPDGTQRWLLTSKAPLRNSAGEVVGLVGTARDITERKRVEEALRQSEERYRILAETAQDFIFIIDRDFKIEYVNQFGAAFLGSRPDQVIGQTMHRRFPPETAIQQATNLQKVLQTGQPLLVESHMTLGGNVIWLSTRLTPLRGADGTVQGVLGLARDITTSKRAEEDLRKAAIFLHLSPAAIGVSTLAEGRYLEVNEAFERMFGYSRAEVIGRTATDLNFWTQPGDRGQIIEQLREHSEIYNHESRLQRRSGEVFPALFSAVTFEMKGVACQIALISDITEKKQMEEALKRSEELYRTLAEAAQDSISMVDRTTRVTYINPFGAAVLGKTVSEVLGQSLAQLFPAAAADQQQRLVKQVFETGEALGAETFYSFPDRPAWMSTRLIPLLADDGSVRSVFGLARDITTQKVTEQALARQAQELVRSNADLEKFAYVASHDLQEPLRMVSSYVQLLQRRYQGQLDADADKMIGFAVDGATRMQRLILDLLDYSRVGTRGEEFAPADLNAALEAALANLQLAIEENGAQVLPTRLPTVVADSAQITQLFQNLIGNALKFRRPQTPPEIRIAAEPQTKEWLFYVRDNGIGIEQKYALRIFEIFQRLHKHSEYPGTGIGLAICKKIVERHGGRIWVESTPGQGATFYFTLPRSARTP